MEFQITPDSARLFADAMAAHMRSRADVAQSYTEREAWHTLWSTFSDAGNVDADSVTLTVPRAAAELMYLVWGTRNVWRDEPTRQSVTAQLRPQWRAQMHSPSATR